MIEGGVEKMVLFLRNIFLHVWGGGDPIGKCLRYIVLYLVVRSPESLIHCVICRLPEQIVHDLQQDVHLHGR